MSGEPAKQREYLSFMSSNAWYMMINQQNPVEVIRLTIETILADQAKASSDAVSELLSSKEKRVYTSSIQKAILNARPVFNVPGVPVEPIRLAFKDEGEEPLDFIVLEEEDAP